MLQNYYQSSNLFLIIFSLVTKQYNFDPNTSTSFNYYSIVFIWFSSLTHIFSNLKGHYFGSESSLIFSWTAKWFELEWGRIWGHIVYWNQLLLRFFGDSPLFFSKIHYSIKFKTRNIFVIHVQNMLTPAFHTMISIDTINYLTIYLRRENNYLLYIVQIWYTLVIKSDTYVTWTMISGKGGDIQ